jgi:hypothetical protein
MPILQAEDAAIVGSKKKPCFEALPSNPILSRGVGKHKSTAVGHNRGDNLVRLI